ncbi:hypothetical protein [Klebsiella pneumoniae]
MADNASQKTEPRNQRNAGNNRPLGMVISKLKPLSSEFYTHFHEKTEPACASLTPFPMQFIIFSGL